MRDSERKKLQTAFEEIIRKTSCEMPRDVVRTIDQYAKKEQAGSRAAHAMAIILKNIQLASGKSQPVCQDTGSILFYIRYPARQDADELARVVRKAVAVCTRKGYLRQNSVDSVTGETVVTNVGPGTPVLHLTPWKKDSYDIRLILKGGGCENVGIQYSLPDSRLGAGRDLAGVRKCILDAVHQAQGKGCGPGILGVIIGGDRATAYAASKEQFLRKLDDRNADPVLDRMEQDCLEAGNTLGIGPMGFGGGSTLLGVKVGALHRLPASFFVTVSYMCWAFRRQGAALSRTGEILRWLY